MNKKRKKKEEGMIVKINQFIDRYPLLIITILNIVYNICFVLRLHGFDYSVINFLKSNIIFGSEVIRIFSFLFKNQVIINFILSLVFIIIFFKIVEEMFDKTTAFFSTLMFILSPIFVFLFGTLNHFSFFSTIFLLGILLKIKKKNILGSVLLVLSSINYFFLLLTFIAFFLFDVPKKEKKIIFIDGILIFIHIYYTVLERFIDLKLNFYPVISFVESVFELSNLISIRIISMILFFISFIILIYRKKLNINEVYFIIAIFLSLWLSYYSKYVLILGAIFINMFSGVAIKNIIEMKYSSTLIKELTIILLLTLIIFPVPLIFVKASEINRDFAEGVTLLNLVKDFNKNDKIVIEPKYVCLVSSLNQNNIAFFNNSLCSGFYQQGVHKLLNKASFIKKNKEWFFVETRFSNDSLNYFRRFLSIVDVYEFKKAIKKNNIKYIILTSSLEEYLKEKNTILLNILEKNYNAKTINNVKIISCES